MTSEDFEKTKYYELFVNNGSNYPAYWMSSRGVDMGSYTFFIVRSMDSSNVQGKLMYFELDHVSNQTCAIRPIITLNSNVQIEAQSNKDGSTPENAYTIK